MADLVPADQIESRVGARRHPTEHIARGNTTTGALHILHPDKCVRTYFHCPWVVASERQQAWLPPDEPVLLRLRAGKFVTAPLPKDYLLEVEP